MPRNIFGHLDDGAAVHEVILDNGLIKASFISWGAVLRDLCLRIDGETRPVVLGFRNLSDYLTYSRNHGANVGRYGGRIRDAKLVIDGMSHPLSRNLSDQHHAHGGMLGLGRRNWQLVTHDDSSVTFEIASPDKDEGYPGDLQATCCYHLRKTALVVTINAQVSQKSPVNFLHHSYFNLDGTGRIHGHKLQIPASQIIEFDDEGLPTGRIVPVAGTRYDFREPRLISDPAQFDTSYVLSGGLQTAPRFAGALLSARGDLRMDVHTTEPGLHFYSGFAVNAPATYVDGRPCLPETGICLEATRFNDAVNMPQFGDVIISPQRPYHQQTEFHFQQLS